MRNPFKRQYFYVVTKINGKIVVWDKTEWTNESQANQAAFKALKGRMFQVVSKPYHDQARVTSEAKAMHLEDSADLETSIQRASHQPDKLKFDERTDNAI